MLDNIFDVLHTGYSTNNIIYANQCLGYFLVSAFYMPYNKYNQGDNYIKNSISFMGKNIDKSLSLEDLSNLNGLSKSHFNEVFKEKMGYSDQYYFSRIFKKIIGKCPSDYRKIQKARLLQHLVKVA